MVFRRRRNKRPVLERQAVVYMMLCPVRGQVVYIGHTVDFYRRCKAHLNGCGIGSKKAKFIRKMISQGLTPTFEIIRRFPNVWEAKIFEQELIKEVNPELNSSNYAQ